ncbi:Hypothetical predicted protein [Mytilus galloprovincialis]|uniref:Uncharacterized protein n=1 Tax=Mytilus galloprovincialis TaxID=29158 RepID=A0A8B6D367_MYTGA|nr:Hypothetical predicted protein [Mytilus galloprovincialis]
MVPLLVVPETDYNRSVPVIIGTNVLRPIKSTLTCDSQVNIPREWETAFSAMDASITSLVKSTNRRPIKAIPMSIMTVTGLCKAKSGNQTAVTECLDDNQGSLGICPRVVSLKPTGKRRVPVRTFNMTAKTIYLKPRSVICGLNEVKIVRHADLDSSDENTESSKKGDEQDKGKILEKLGVELTELTPEMKVREQSHSRSKKGKSPTRPSLELQKDDIVKSDENDQMLNEVSDNSEEDEDEDEDEDDDICVVVTRSPGIRDKDRNASLVLNPRTLEFLPTSFW